MHIHAFLLIYHSIDHINVSKIDENRCKQTVASFLFLGVQVVSVYSYIEPTTDYCICACRDGVLILVLVLILTRVLFFSS